MAQNFSITEQLRAPGATCAPARNHGRDYDCGWTKRLLPILAMAQAYDRACGSLRTFGNASTVQEIVAQQIIEVARKANVTRIDSTTGL